MTQVIKNVTAFMGFGFVAFMHVYFVLLLMVKPALAEEKVQKVVVETTAVGASTATATTPTAAEPSVNDNVVDDNEFTFNINDKKGTVRIDDNGIQIGNLKDIKGEEAATVISNLGKINTVSQWSEVLQEVLVPIVLFLSAFGFAGYYVYAKSRTRRDYLDTIKALAQSGQPIPQELLNSLNATLGSGKILAPGKTQFDASAVQGVKYIFWGIGFIGSMILLEKAGFIAAVGFVFIVMGAFHIYTTQNMQKQKATDTTAATTPEIK